MTLKNVSEQTEEICLEAVRKDPTEFLNVEYQTPAICLEAVKGDGLLLTL